MKTKQRIFTVILAIAVASSSYGANYTWSKTGNTDLLWNAKDASGTFANGYWKYGTTYITNPGTYTGGPHNALVNQGYAPILIDNSVAASASTFYLGYNSGTGNIAKLTMTGGTLDVAGFAMSRGGTGSDSRFDFDGGAITITAGFQLGYTSAKTATFDMTAGTITANTLNAIHNLAGAGTTNFNMSGGVVDFTSAKAYLSGNGGLLNAVLSGNADFKAQWFTNDGSGGTASVLIKDNAVITVLGNAGSSSQAFNLASGNVTITLDGNGKLRLAGNQLENSLINSWIGNKIVGANGATVYKQAVAGYTEYSIVPEPATITMLALGLGALISRKKK